VEVGVEELGEGIGAGGERERYGKEKAERLLNWSLRRPAINGSVRRLFVDRRSRCQLCFG
jgi:hypothetical protein